MDPEVYPYDDYTCRLVRLPGDVHALIAETEDGWPLIWINDALSPQARTKAFWHEMQHFLHGDLHHDWLDIWALEHPEREESA